MKLFKIIFLISTLMVTVNTLTYKHRIVITDSVRAPIRVKFIMLDTPDEWCNETFTRPPANDPWRKQFCHTNRAGTIRSIEFYDASNPGNLKFLARANPACNKHCNFIVLDKRGSGFVANASRPRGALNNSCMDSCRVIEH